MESEHNIVEQLHAAFPDEEIESIGAFTEWGSSYPDAAPYRAQLEGRTWTELDRAYLVRRSDALGFLGTRQLVAVLPVYLNAMVEDGVGSPATEMLTLLLAKPLAGEDSGLGHRRFNALVECMTPAQSAAVASCLAALARQDPDGSLGRSAGAAFEGYWNTHLPAA
ncbi:MAG: hypothetical protein WKG01_29540 [Kofleriaceae bacterium]